MATNYGTAPNVTNGLVLFYDPGNDTSYPGSGTSITSLLNENTGTLTNTAFSSANGGSLTFNGSAYITMTNINLSGEFTFCFWVYPNAFNFAAIGDSNSTNWLRIYSATRTDLDLANTQHQWESGVTFTTGEWQHIVLRRDSSNVCTIFRNGIHYTNNAPTKSGTWGPLFKIGEKANGNRLNGNLGPTQLYDRSLSVDEVNKIYNSAKGRFA